MDCRILQAFTSVSKTPESLQKHQNKVLLAKKTCLPIAILKANSKRSEKLPGWQHWSHLWWYYGVCRGASTLDHSTNHAFGSETNTWSSLVTPQAWWIARNVTREQMPKNSGRQLWQANYNHTFTELSKYQNKSLSTFGLLRIIHCTEGQIIV